MIMSQQNRLMYDLVHPHMGRYYQDQTKSESVAPIGLKATIQYDQVQTLIFLKIQH